VAWGDDKRVWNACWEIEEKPGIFEGVRTFYEKTWKLKGNLTQRLL
jgi:hypothetical protein